MFIIFLFARVRWIACVLVAVFAHQPVNAAENIREYMWHDFTSVAQPQARPVLEVGSLLTATLFLAKWSAVKPMQEEFGVRKPLGKWSHAGDIAGQWVPNAAYYVGMLSTSLFTGQREPRYLGNFMLRSSGYASLLAVLLKTLIREERPNRGDNQASFPSGHSATAFAFAGSILMQHGWYWAVPAFALAGYVGLTRMNDRYHYLHDVAGGATIGLSYAIGLYYLDQKRRESGEEVSRKFRLLPMPVIGGSGVVARYEF